jgi:outer membrane protein assembly factor BamB
MRKLVYFCLLSLLLTDVTLRSEDWPQWRGPQRTEVSNETDLLESWSKDGPPLVWLTRDAGLGYSGPSIVGEQIYLMGSRGKKEYLIALDATTGDELWAREIGKRFNNRWGNGPRGTPTVEGAHVYALGANGDLLCCQRHDGTVVWKANMEELGGVIPQWGYAESVLVDGDQIVCTPGGDDGAIVALHVKTGKVVWQSKDVTDLAHYSSIVPMTVGNRKTYVQLFGDQVLGVDAEKGARLWSLEWNGRIAVIPTPIVDGNRVYVTSGYGSGSMMCEISADANSGKFSAREIYRNKVMKNHHGGVLLYQGRLYGYADGTGWVCQDFVTGEQIWRERDAFGKGALACADGKLYCIDERTGDVALVDATASDGWKELSRFRLTPQTKLRKAAGAIWTHPVISNGRLYLRDQELFFCFDVSARTVARRETP